MNQNDKFKHNEQVKIKCQQNGRISLGLQCFEGAKSALNNLRPHVAAIVYPSNNHDPAFTEHLRHT